MKANDDVVIGRMKDGKVVTTPAKKRPKLAGEIIDIYKEDIASLTEKVKVLERKVLAHDKQKAVLERAARSATADADALLEAVSVLAGGISSDRKEGRRVRAAARKLLESRRVTPPSTLGSSRKRARRRGKKEETP